MGIGSIFARRPGTTSANGHGNNNDVLPDVAVNEKHAHGNINNQHRSNRLGMSDPNRRPPFGAWLKRTWVDIVTMVVMGALGLGVYVSPPAPSRSFPVYFNDGEIVYPQFAYPLRNEIVPIWAAALLAALVPIAVFLIMQIRIRSFWDAHNAIMGLLYSLITAAVFQVFLKCLIGGLRPHFLAVCKPNIPAVTLAETGNGLRSIMYDRRICTGDVKEINDALESFPSGHSTAAFAGFVFLSIYLNAKLKVFSNYHPAMWKLIAVYAPILGATLIAGALTIDEFHNWYDCLAGAIIGTIFAFSSYRMVYCSIWDWRTNHIPLNRLAPFNGFTNTDTPLGHAVFTRRAGWGVAEVRDHVGSSGHQHNNGGYLNGNTSARNNDPVATDIQNPVTPARDHRASHHGTVHSNHGGSVVDSPIHRKRVSGSDNIV